MNEWKAEVTLVCLCWCRPPPKAQWGVVPFTGEGLGLPWPRSLEAPDLWSASADLREGESEQGGAVLVAPHNTSFL